MDLPAMTLVWLLIVAWIVVVLAHGISRAWRERGTSIFTACTPHDWMVGDYVSVNGELVRIVAVANMTTFTYRSFREGRA